MRVFTNLIHGYYKTFVIISVELCDVSQKLKYQVGLLYSFRYIEISKSSKADIRHVLKPKEPLMSTQPVPCDRPPGGFGGGLRQIGGVVAGDDGRCLLLILIA